MLTKKRDDLSAALKNIIFKLFGLWGVKTFACLNVPVSKQVGKMRHLLTSEKGKDKTWPS